MRTSLLWKLVFKSSRNESQVVQSVTFSPNGALLVVTIGHNLLLYTTEEHELLQTLKGHKDVVYCVEWSGSGSRLASGGADKAVIIWNRSGEPVMKYHHNDAVQAIAHNFTTGQIASGTATDFALWSEQNKTVAKFKIDAKILCASWNNDGKVLAFGLDNGQVSLRNQAGNEISRLLRGSAPVWTVSWIPPSDQTQEVLVVTDWNQKLAFFEVAGAQIGRDRNLSCDPTSVAVASSGQYLVIGGSDRKVSLWTCEGARITDVCDCTAPVRACTSRPQSEDFAVGCDDGTLQLFRVLPDDVWAGFRDRFAFRDNLTDVIIHNLVDESRARIKCRDYVRKLSLYSRKLAVQLSDRVIVYEANRNDGVGMHYRITDKIPMKDDCEHLVVTAKNVVIGRGSTLTSLALDGNKKGEWRFDAPISIAKCVGGALGREGIVVGLANGHVIEVFLGTSVLLPIVQVSAEVKALDISSSRQKIAVIDSAQVLQIHDLRSKELLFQEPGVEAVVWNPDYDGLLCYSSACFLHVKVEDLPSHPQRVQGKVVAVVGSRAFCLSGLNLYNTNVALTTLLDMFLEARDFQAAYQLACAGATDSDWRRLALSALEALELSIARKCFTRLHDLKFLRLLKELDKLGGAALEQSRDSMSAEIYSYEERYFEAADSYRKAGLKQQAIDLFSDLNMWDEAIHIADEASSDKDTILKRKAQSHADKNDLLVAAITFSDAGDYSTAIEILGTNGYMEQLVEIARKIPSSEGKALSRCILYFRQQNRTDYVIETLQKMGDVEHLVVVYSELQRFDDAFRLLDLYPELAPKVHLPFAHWLAMNDRFVEAEESFRKAGRVDEALKVLQQLCTNAVREERFGDASYYNWLLAKHYLDQIPADVEKANLDLIQQAALRSFNQYVERARMFYAYFPVHRYVEEPFTSHSPEALLNMCRFSLAYAARQSWPVGMSKSHIFWAFAKLGKRLQAFRLARYALDKLLILNAPLEWLDAIEMAALSVRAKPDADLDEIRPLCCRCSTLNTVMQYGDHGRSDHCGSCEAEFIPSMYSFDHLPLVEFTLEDDIPATEAETLISTDPRLAARTFDAGDAKQEGRVGKVDDSLTVLLSTTDQDGTTSAPPAKVGRRTLAMMPPDDVFWVDWGKRCLPRRYFRAIVTQDLPISFCTTCKHFWEATELEFLLLKEGRCPFCRTKRAVE
ncbi:hypothetical protein M427DRAFT_115320 [Gonapodya prolifera JEL478]|uniref:Intraflagellar transport protein 122 homolog n=1 Tax=Gonapodya prolifera (strain JEL478) TaxID=1344416 RepID=A0A139A2L1_GONPJ|nr:hypothetical protein M427DRAFT_115320 [Gonapodya prolifera JEL478]|eukprot:KXS11002.1 hypothetical protein M427DRAFT_115320 [Gonapodya prolifera JEL478]